MPPNSSHMQAKAMNMKTGKALERSAAMRSSISCSSGRWPESPGSVAAAWKRCWPA